MRGLYPSFGRTKESHSAILALAVSYVTIQNSLYAKVIYSGVAYSSPSQYVKQI